MADDLNRLLIKIQADTSQLSSALQRAEAGVANSSKRIESTLDRNAAKFKGWADGIGRQFKSLVAGYLGVELASKAFDALGNVASIQKLARDAALSTDAFQELTFAVKQAGASVNDMSAGLSTFSVNMAQVRLNTGGFNQFLREQAPALRVALAATTNQAQAVSVLSDFMAGLGDESDKTTLLQKAFGRSSNDLVAVLDKGSVALRNAADDAHKFGDVLKNEDIKAANETKKAFDELFDSVTLGFEKMVVGAASAGKSVIDAFEDALKNHNFSFAGDNDPLGINTLLDALLGKPQGRSFTLESKGNGGPAKVPKTSLRPKPDNTGRDALARLTQQFDQSNGNIQQVLQDQYDQELQQWQDMLDKKQISEQQFAEARTQLGVIMLNQQKENLNAQTQLEKDYLTSLRDGFESTFMDAFGNALDGGKFKAKEFFNSLLQDFAKVTMEVLVLKPLMNSLFSDLGSNGPGGGAGGLLSGLLGGIGSIFGGFLADGGPAQPGKPYVVGERGPELFVPNSSGRVKNARETTDIFTPSYGNSRGGTSVSNNSTVINNTIDARGADIGVVQRVQAALAASHRNQPNPVAAVRQASKRFPARG